MANKYEATFHPNDGPIIKTELVEEAFYLVYSSENSDELFDRWLNNIMACCWDEGYSDSGVLLPTNPPKKKKNPYRDE